MSTCAPLNGTQPRSASSTAIVSASGTPAWTAPALLAAVVVLARTSARRRALSSQYGPSVMVGVSVAQLASVAAAAGAAPSPALAPPSRAEGGRGRDEAG